MRKTGVIAADFTFAVQIVTGASISCLLCGRQHSVEMPKYATQAAFECPDCGYRTQASKEACCVFCEHGSRNCPPQQRRALYFNRKNTGQ